MLSESLAPDVLKFCDMKRTLVFLLAAMALAVAGTTAFAQASVTTDQSDYPPGSTVQISGSGFQPGETVQLQVVNLTNPSDTGAEHDP
jgi:ABC-type phosphate transport system substrate-binding protein